MISEVRRSGVQFRTYGNTFPIHSKTFCNRHQNIDPLKLSANPLPKRIPQPDIYKLVQVEPDINPFGPSS